MREPYVDKMPPNEKNFKHTQTPCPQCKTNTHTLLDDIHAEIYCTKCGIIIQDTQLTKKRL